jgi:hypothetical protein
MAVHKSIDGVKLDEETYAAVKKMADRGIGKGRGERKAVTIAEMCAALVHTGVFRRIAANKWAKAHPAPKAAKKPAKEKSPKKKASAKKSVKKGSKKPARASKPKAAKKETAPPAGTNSAAPAPSTPPAGGGVLD